MSFKDIVAGQVSVQSSVQQSVATKPADTEQIITPTQQPQLPEQKLPSGKESLIESDLPAITEVWNSYYNELETGFPRHAVILSQSTFSIQNNTLVIVLSSATQEDLFRTEILKEIKQRICKRLSLTTLLIQVTIAEPVEKTAKPYSSTDKYNYLLEKNQNLAKLKERFNLNIKS